MSEKVGLTKSVSKESELLCCVPKNANERGEEQRKLFSTCWMMPPSFSRLDDEPGLLQKREIKKSKTEGEQRRSHC